MRPIQLLLLLLLSSGLLAQRAAKQGGVDLNYYLPELAYNPNIPTPEEFLGWQIGDWHISHDLMQAYLKTLAASSDRVILQEYARSYEERPLMVLIFTSPENHKNLGELQEKHLKLSQLGTAGSDDLVGVPGVLYQGYNIHGNEPSGGNAAVLIAYYLAAAPMSEVGQLLNENIVLIDPCLNPDGFNRFASWANMHKARKLNPDPQDREYSESWPRGRTNHYWFDLNRDWFPVQHPESRGRVKLFQSWRPNVLTDHHEMGTNATFFFMPGEPTRVYPGTPKINQALTKQIGTYHAKALDEIGSLYYSGEGYDDYYIGKGSTYPDMQGTVGILFEQASSRGHVQESDNGLLTFPFTIRNQVATSLSTQAAFVEMREELLAYQRDYYRKSKTERGGYVVDADGDPARLVALADLLSHHDIYFKQIGDDDSPPEGMYIPHGQVQHQLLDALFGTIDQFEDSLFYDVSTWTLPYTFNLPTKKVSEPVDHTVFGASYSDSEPGEIADYAYFIPWDQYYAPKIAYRLMDAGLRVKVAHKPFTLMDGTELGRGSIMVPVQNQGNLSTNEVAELVYGTNREKYYNEYGEQREADVYQTDFITPIPVSTGSVSEGLMLGSRSAYSTLKKPEILLLVDGGVNSLDAGEVWHLLDQRFDIPVTKMELGDVAWADLSRYNVIVMSDGNYSGLGSSGASKIKSWMGYGKTLITCKRSATWAKNQGLANLETRSFSNPSSKSNEERRPYELASRDRGGRVLGGAIFQTEGDLTHPLLYGYQRTDIPVFRRGTLLFEPTKNDYATPLRYTDAPLLSGYSPRGFEEKAAGSAAIIVSGSNGGRTICFADNPNFRALMYGTNKLFMNAIFFGQVISGSTAE
ncbi:MAG: M14 family zinc carboxypeptidase [Bacteroidota bacterium]